MKFQLIIEVDVENATTESEGRKAAYDLGAILNNPKKGRRAAGPSASVTGIRVESIDEDEKMNTVPMPSPKTTSVINE